MWIRAVLTALLCVTLVGSVLAEEVEATAGMPYTYDDYTLMNSAQNAFAELTLSQTPYATITASDQIPNSNLSWCLDNTGLLSVSGTGVMPDYTVENHAPWYESKYNIKSVVIKNGITGIGAYAFSSCDHITSVQLPDNDWSRCLPGLCKPSDHNDSAQCKPGGCGLTVSMQSPYRHLVWRNGSGVECGH